MKVDFSCFLSLVFCRLRRLWPVASFLTVGFCLVFSVFSFAEELTILYTGNTHAALYHCNCPIEPDGGVARRMTKVGQLRLENPNTILVDAGGFFAGGIFDDHSQGIVLDKARSDINLEALGLMNYDALNVGDEEFNLGKDYLVASVAKSKIPFLSANLKIAGVKPYIIKKISDLTIAVIGLTNEEARGKSEGLALESPQEALTKSIEEVRNKKADLVLVLSYLGEEKDKELIEKVKGVDIIISGRTMNSSQPYSKIGSTVLLRSAWQGRRLGRINLQLDGAKIKDFKVELMRLSSEIPDDVIVAKILPKCFVDSDCRQDKLIGTCSKPGKKEAGCIYGKPKQIELLVIRNDDAPAPNEKKFIESLNSVFPGLAPRFISYETDEGKLWIDKANAKLLPVYLLSKDAESENGFGNINNFLELKGEYYYISPKVAGASFFLGRTKIDKRIDVFLSSKDKSLEFVLSVLKELQARHKDLMIGIHFLAIEASGGFTSGGGFTAPNGLTEVEEDLRLVCIQHNYPEKFWDYALCRARSQNSSWWDSCANEFGVDTAQIKKCSTSDEGKNYLRENIKLNKELEISVGPTLLIGNQKAYYLGAIAKAEDLEKLIFQDSSPPKKE